MSGRGYKKYMKKDARQEHPLIKIFIISFFSMLLISTLIINAFAKKMIVDTSVGDYKEQQYDEMEDKKIIDVNRLEMIQNEDQGKNFSDLMQNPVDEKKNNIQENTNSIESDVEKPKQNTTVPSPQKQTNQSEDTIYKIYIGSYSSSEQAKVAKEIILESGSGLNPIVKCIGANEYTLQVGIFKNKQSAEALLSTIIKNNLPGRIVIE